VQRIDLRRLLLLLAIALMVRAGVVRIAELQAMGYVYLRP